MTPRQQPLELLINEQRWEVVRDRINKFWVAREAPHISIMAQTRTGKSYLIRHGLMPLCRWDRVLFIDVKGNDRTLAGLGRPVREIPGRMAQMKQLMREKKPEDNWFRLVTYKGPDNRDAAREQVKSAFDRVLKEGDWVVIFDELRAITDPSSPGLHLKPYYEEFILRGGSNGIATISASQEPRWCPGSFYTQSNFYLFSRIEDDAAQKRLSEVGSNKALLPHISTIQRKHWIYMDNMEESGERWWAKTMIL